MYISANKKLCQLLGLSLDELYGKTDYDIYPPETADRYASCDRKVMEERRPIASGEEDHEEGGRRIYTISRKVPLIDESGTVKGIIGLAFDVTELKEAQEKLAVSLHEKEMLFKEVHHRVKNNMQIISSLLNLQGYQMSSEKDRELLMASINRIQSMSMVHEMLYQSGNISRIELSLYMKNLVSYIFSMYAVSSELITVEWGRMDDIDVNIDAGINCGLIVTEIVTNSIKYAFPERRKGSIQVGLRAEDEALILGIGDNGIGMREDILKGERSSLGLSLVESLVAQMEGSLNISSEGGTSYKISFPLSLVKASGI
jgi:PAS domain S-box-containing protein